MKTIPRSEFLANKNYRTICEKIKEKYNCPDFARDLLIKNIKIKGFAVRVEHYASLTSENKTTFISYRVESWVLDRSKGQMASRIIEITIYDNYMEYESRRLKEVHSEKQSTGSNLN